MTVSKHASNVQTNHTISSLINKKEIKEVYERMIEKIIHNDNPSSELFLLFSHQKIKENILNLSNKDTVDTIEILFSEKNVFTKLKEIKKNVLVMNNVKKSESVQIFEDMLNQYVHTNLSYHSSDFFIPESFQSTKNKTILYQGWGTFLNENPKLITSCSLSP